VRDELSYFGGLIDGEGCFTFCKARNRAVTPVFALASTSKVISGFVEEVLKKNEIKYSATYKDRGDGTKPFITVRVQSLGNIERLIDLMLPYILEKRPQAELIKEYVAVRKQYGNNNMDWNQTEHIVSNVRTLNARGVKTQTL
jgi:hypothetical protein